MVTTRNQSLGAKRKKEDTDTDTISVVAKMPKLKLARGTKKVAPEAKKAAPRRRQDFSHAPQ